MSRITRRWAIAQTTVLAWLGVSRSVKAQGTKPEEKPVGKAFQLADLRKQREPSGRPYVQFLNLSSMRMGVYALAAGAEDKQMPHQEDEVYYVTKGKATLRVEDQELAAVPGALLFVAARAAHKFVSITEDLEVVVFFSTAK